MADAGPVHHHTCLEWRGGATRIARTLARLSPSGSSLSCEVAEPDPESGNGPGDGKMPGEGREPTAAVLPDASALAGCVPAGALLHIHATQDWPALLEAALGHAGPVVVTAHDFSLLTGGCVYPLSCDRLEAGCPDPCPRAFPDAQAHRRRMASLVGALAPVLVSPSGWLARRLRAAWPELAVRVVPNGVPVPVQLGDKAEARSRLGIRRSARVALYVAHGGSGASYKGGARIRSQLAAVAAAVPGALGVIAGGGELRREENLLCLPYLDGEMLEALYRAADVMVYPSLADNHPLVVLEAMAHGLAVAAYAVGGIPEQLTHGATGLLLPPGDEDGLIRAVSSLLADNAAAQHMGERAREKALRHFGEQRMARDYAQVHAHARENRADPRAAGQPG